MISFMQVRFGYVPGREVLRGVDLELTPGLTLMVGPNGNGKSTLLKLAAGVEMPSCGSIEVGGHDLWRDEVAARRHLAYVPEFPDLTPYATLREILTLVCGLRGEPAGAVDEALAWVGLETVAGRTVRELSKGQRRRAVVAAARIGRPDCLLLDEPLEGMDRAFRLELLTFIERRRAEGATLIVVSHDLAALAGLADRALTLRDGRCVMLEELPAGEARISALEDLARG